MGAASPSQLTPADEARLGRVQTKEAEEAGTKKDTYIPRDLGTKVEAVQPSPTPSNGPGPGYTYNGGDPSRGAADPQREAAIRSGIEKQLGAIIARMEPPGTQSAAAYQAPQSPQAQAAAAQVAPASSGASAAAGAAPEVQTLVRGLSIAAARLASPCDTSKTAFVSAVVDGGPLAGAYLVGQCKLVGETGVQVTFSKMTVGNESYAVNVTALDSGTSSDALAADIDRKLLSRYVMPVLFSTLSAYTAAIGRPSQVVVASAGVSTQVTTPSATSRQALGAGVSAGINKAGEGLGQAKPSAFMPIDTSISLLFNDAVLKKASK